jgi:hypothetical protein
VFVGKMHIGSIGKHYHETRWWWQLRLMGPQSRRTQQRVLSIRRVTYAGMCDLKKQALEQLGQAWNSYLPLLRVE